MQLIPTIDAVQAIQGFPRVSVGGSVLSEQAIAEEMQFHPADSVDEAWRAAARGLVIRELLLSEARELGIDAELSEEQRIATVIERAVVVPAPDEVACRRFYDTNPRRFRTSPLIAVSHILLAAAPDDINGRMEQQDAGEALLEKLLTQPGRFAEFARDYSVCQSRHMGGTLGQLSRGQTVREFERVVWRLPEGLHNRLVESRFGWHLVRVDQRVEGRELGFDQVKADIQAYLLEQVTRRALRQYLQVLAGEAGVTGVDLELPDSPLLQ